MSKVLILRKENQEETEEGGSLPLACGSQRHCVGKGPTQGIRSQTPSGGWGDDWRCFTSCSLGGRECEGRCRQAKCFSTPIPRLTCPAEAKVF